MIEPLNTLQRVSYSQNQMKEPVEKMNPDSGAKQERAASLGFYQDSQIPAVLEKEKNGLEESGRKKGKNPKNFDSYECETCKNRTYQDGSNDMGVSFKTPTKLDPNQAASAVRAHENEHVSRNQAKAKQENREVVSQSVTYQTGVCPECGKVYIAGGTTRTVTKGQVEKTYGLNDGAEASGQQLDLVV